MEIWKYGLWVVVAQKQTREIWEKEVYTATWLYIVENMKIRTLGCSTTETDNGNLREGSILKWKIWKYGLWVVVAQKQTIEIWEKEVYTGTEGRKL